MTPLSIILPGTILLAAVIDDLKTQKVHNWLTASAMIIALIASFALGGIDGLRVSALGGVAALALSAPLFMIRAIGGGDVKLLMALGFATDVMSVFWILVYSFMWGALLGIFKALLNGQALPLLKNTISLLYRADRKSIELHKVPYTVALLFGWLTHLSFQGWSLI